MSSKVCDVGGGDQQHTLVVGGAGYVPSIEDDVQRQVPLPGLWSAAAGQAQILRANPNHQTGATPAHAGWIVQLAADDQELAQCRGDGVLLQARLPAKA